MRRDDWHHAACAEDEPAAFGLLDGVLRFCLDFATVAQYDGVLADATAHLDAENLLSFGKGRRRLAVVPVDDREWSTEE